MARACFPALLMIGCLIYIYTRQASSGGSEVGPDRLHSPATAIAIS